jgi:hypothetical protein
MPRKKHPDPRLLNNFLYELDCFHGVSMGSPWGQTEFHPWGQTVHGVRPSFKFISFQDIHGVSMGSPWGQTEFQVYFLPGDRPGQVSGKGLTIKPGRPAGVRAMFTRERRLDSG